MRSHVRSSLTFCPQQEAFLLLHHVAQQPPGPGLRPDPGRSLLADRRHFYSSSSSCHDGARSSCGLEPADLALLAEDILTLESRPHVVRQLRGRRGTVQGLDHDWDICLHRGQPEPGSCDELQ